MMIARKDGMPRSDADLRSIHRFSAQHRELLEKSEFAGCFYCEARFPPSTITEWVDPAPDEVAAGEELDCGTTALCPHCGIDAVLPSAAPFAWDDSLLHDMHVHWFSSEPEGKGSG